MITSFEPRAFRRQSPLVYILPNFPGRHNIACLHRPGLSISPPYNGEIQLERHLDATDTYYDTSRYALRQCHCSQWCLLAWLCLALANSCVYGLPESVTRFNDAPTRRNNLHSGYCTSGISCSAHGRTAHALPNMFMGGAHDASSCFLRCSETVTPS